MVTFFLSVADVFNSGIWQGMELIEHPELQQLAARLPRLALLSRREGTVNNYVNGYIKWKTWALNFAEVTILPADPKFFALYLLHLQDFAKTHAPISMAFYSISWVHRMAGLKDPTEHPLPKMVRDSAVRLLGKGQNKKLPLMASELGLLVDKFDGNNISLIDLRTITMCLLAYAGFFRFDEISKIRRSDIVFYPTYVKLFVEQSKTDICREGKWVFIGKTGLPTCPVTMLQRYLIKAQIADNSVKYVFRAMTYFRSKKIHKLRASDKCLSYTTTREFMLSAFKTIGLDESKLGTHSLRAGGATAAANNSICDRLFKKHGRWLSEKAKDGYVVEGLEQILSVSLSLGI